MITKVINKRNKILLFKELNLKQLTIVSGCNGAGKTTFLKEIMKCCVDDKKEERTFNDTKQTLELVYDKPIKINSYSNSENNYTNIDPNNRRQNDYIKNCLGIVNTSRKSEGEAMIFSFLDYIESNDINNDSVLLIDEIDSGLSADALNGLSCVLKNMYDQNGIQIIITSNNYYFPFVFKNNILDVTTGEYVKIKSFEEFLKFNQGMAYKLSKVRGFTGLENVLSDEYEEKTKQHNSTNDLDSTNDYDDYLESLFR